MLVSKTPGVFPLGGFFFLHCNSTVPSCEHFFHFFLKEYYTWEGEWVYSKTHKIVLLWATVAHQNGQLPIRMWVEHSFTSFSLKTLGKNLLGLHTATWENMGQHSVRSHRRDRKKRSWVVATAKIKLRGETNNLGEGNVVDRILLPFFV